MKITYYVEVLSSWCHWVEPVWAELKSRYAGRAEFEWKIALMNPGDFPASQAQCDWFYRRSGGTVMNSPYMLNSGWFEAERQGDYRAPNLVAEAAKDFGVTDDRVRQLGEHLPACLIAQPRPQANVEIHPAHETKAAPRQPRRPPGGDPARLDAQRSRTT